jgi:hypothetical protein
MATMGRVGEVKLRKFPKSTTVTATVKVKLTREFKVRMWLALRVIALGVWISGASFEVNDDAGDSH